jgi:glycosyltransferase involved in cell wall biosynthesis
MEIESISFNTKKKDYEVSVIAPMYNEEAVIQQNIMRIMEAIQRLPEKAEFILVNDGSSDKSLELAKAAAENQSDMTIVSYPQNKGRGFALRQGFAFARGDYIITTESDLSWGEGIIEKLLRKLKEDKKYDMVIASPYLAGGRLENVPAKRSFLSTLGNKILCNAVSGNLSMLSGMTRGYKREVIDSLYLKSNDKEIHLEIVSKVLTLGYNITEIPAILRWEKATPGKARRKSKFKAKKYVLSHLVFSFNEYPFMLFGTIGLTLAILGVIMGVYSLILSIMGTPVGGRPIVMASILLILFGMMVSLCTFLANQQREISNEFTRLYHLILTSQTKDRRDKK